MTVSLIPCRQNSRRSSWLKGTKPHWNTWLGSVWPATARRVASTARGRGRERQKNSQTQRKREEKKEREREQEVLFRVTWWNTEQNKVINNSSELQHGASLCYRADSSYFEVWEPWQLVTSPFLPPNPALLGRTFNLSDSSTSLPFLPPSNRPFITSVVAITGDSCGWSILLDCQQLGQGRNFFKLCPWDPLSAGKGVMQAIHVPGLKERVAGFHLLPSPHACRLLSGDERNPNYKSKRCSVGRKSEILLLSDAQVPLETTHFLTFHKWCINMGI